MIKVLSIFLLFVNCANASLIIEKYNPKFTIQKLADGSPENVSTVELPFFVGKGEAHKVGVRINEIIFLTTIGRHAPLKSTDSMPSLINNVSLMGDMAGYDSYSYEIIRNDEKIVSFNIVSEGCRASCSTNNNHYNFDAQSGQFIHVSSLFTPSGLKNISSKLIMKWSKLLQNSAPDELSDDQVKECISNMKTNYDRKIPYTGYDFVIKEDHIQFVGAYCTKMVSSFPATLNYKEISNQLSEYGRSIFLNTKNTDQPIHPYGQIFDGFVGRKYPIKMVLLEPYPSAGYLTGYYLYTKHNKPINIVGEYVNDILIIQEVDDNSKPLGPKITAHPSKNGFSGYWKSHNKKFEFSVVVGQP